jgi:hypothetical protein
MLNIFNIGIIKAVSLSQTQYMDINNPTNGYQAEDSFHITGWAVNKSGVSKVKVYVDNSYVGDAYYGAPTDALKTSFPDFIGSDKAGYDFLINSIKYNSGNNVLNMKMIGNSGTITSQSLSVQLTKSKPAMDVNSPANGSAIKSDFHITGWAVNKNGIKEVKIYSNNNFVG